MTSRYDLTREDFSALLDGEPSYRVDQVWKGLYGQLADIDQISSLPASLRTRLADLDDLAPSLTQIHESVTDNGDTVKLVHALHDGKRIETVLMHYEDRTTVCISSQAGCAMACTFCATGQAGFDRQLSTGEIVEQFVRAQRRAGERRIGNIVFMGMGEPLANWNALSRAITRIHDDLGVGARHITVSTVGVIPGIDKLTEYPLPVNLAVSLHAANDELRTSLVPLNKRYPIADLMAACRRYIEATRRRLSFEWALIHDVNDRPQDVRELADLCLSIGAHVNVIPLNPTPGYLVMGSPRSSVERFANDLRSRGVNVTIRDTRGGDIDAACGQLANRVDIRKKA